MTAEPCIYCRRVDVDRTKEHVLQEAFGATAKLATAVCGECNGAFSPIDKCFIEGVQFYHLGTGVRRQLGLGRAAIDDGTKVRARLRSDGNVEFSPQLYETGPNEWKFIGSDEAQYQQMRKELSDPASLVVKSEVVQPGEGIPRLSILRSTPNRYLVQGTSEPLVEQLVMTLGTKGLMADWGSDPLQRSVSNAPPIDYDTSLAVDDYCRAMAKVALNFVCYRMGAKVALQSEFDAIRKYARHGDGHFSDFVVPTLLNHSVADRESPFFQPNHHGLHLFTAKDGGRRREAVFIVIEGETIGKVELTPDAAGLPNGTWLITRFNLVDKGVEDLSLPDDMPRAMLNPAAVGLQEVWPKEWT